MASYQPEMLFSFFIQIIPTHQKLLISICFLWRPSHTSLSPLEGLNEAGFTGLDWIVWLFSAGTWVWGLPLVVQHLALGGLEQNSDPECKSEKWRCRGMLSGLVSLHMKGTLLWDLFAISKNVLALGGALFQGQQSLNVNTSNTESRKCGYYIGLARRVLVIGPLPSGSFLKFFCLALI